MKSGLMGTASKMMAASHKSRPAPAGGKVPAPKGGQMGAPGQVASGDKVARKVFGTNAC